MKNGISYQFHLHDCKISDSGRGTSTYLHPQLVIKTIDNEAPAKIGMNFIELKTLFISFIWVNKLNQLTIFH